MSQTCVVTLKRNDSSVPWGFRMHGGVDYDKPLFIQKITKNSIAHKAGLEPGDVILQIGNARMDRMSHQQAKMEIIRAGCDMDFMVLKQGIDIKREMAAAQTQPAAPPQPQEEHRAWEGTGAENKQLQSRSFRMLQLSLNESEGGGDRPQSAIDQKRAEAAAASQYAGDHATSY